MRKIIFILSITTLMIFSCKEEPKKNNCESRIINTIFLKKYLIVKDSCNLYKGVNKVKYYDNNRLIMSGFDDRMFKQGEWSFYDNDGKEIIKGVFIDSKPTGDWKFKSQDISWNIYDNENKGYAISAPKKWQLIDNDKEENTITISDTSSIEEYNLKIDVTSASIENMNISVKGFVEETIKLYKENEAVSNIENKKLILKGVDVSYELQYNYNDETGNYLHKEYIYSFKGMVYILSSSLNEKSNYDYEIIDEIMLTSFKITK